MWKNCHQTKKPTDRIQTTSETQKLRELQEKAKQSGFFGVLTPEEYGGMGLGSLMAALIEIELGRTVDFPTDRLRWLVARTASLPKRERVVVPWEPR